VHDDVRDDALARYASRMQLASRLCEVLVRWPHGIGRQTQSDPAGGHPGRVVGGNLGG